LREYPKLIRSFSFATPTSFAKSGGPAVLLCNHFVFIVLKVNVILELSSLDRFRVLKVLIGIYVSKFRANLSLSGACAYASTDYE
jgi:hypothetical protein